MDAALAPYMRTDSSGYKALADHHTRMRDVHMRRLFEDPHRFAQFSMQIGELFVDYSKNIATKETMELLYRLAEERGLRERIDQMFSGAKINFTEDRPVLHV